MKTIIRGKAKGQFSMEDFSTESNGDSYQIFVAGRHVGDVENGVFKKTISGSRHILRKPPAIALSVESLERAELAGACDIQIKDIESGRVYACTVEHFRKYSFPIQRGGFEPQLALPLERFEVSSPLNISSRAPKSGEVKRKAGNGKRVRNPRGVVSTLSPRQLMFKGLL